MGLKVDIVTAGDGKSYPKVGDRILIEYTGMLLDGTIFDDSHGPGKPPFSVEVGVSSVIRALDEGVMLISLGEKAVITATAEYGYGGRGFPPVIPANATLRLEVRLLRIN